MIQKKHIIVAAVSFFALCLLFFLFVTYPRIGKLSVEVLVHPEDATIYINGSKSSAGTTYLRPGTYTFKAEKPGWQEDETTIIISENLTKVALLPLPASEEARELVRDPAVTLEREGLAGIAANARGLDIRNAYPILNKLPRSDIAGPYKIDYGFNQSDEKTPYLIVSFSTPNGREEAIEWLRDNGADVTTTEIIFEDFVSPAHAEERTHE